MRDGSWMSVIFVAVILSIGGGCGNHSKGATGEQDGETSTGSETMASDDLGTGSSSGQDSESATQSESGTQSQEETTESQSVQETDTQSDSAIDTLDTGTSDTVSTDEVDTESSTYTNAEERAKTAFDASCRHGCQMDAECYPDEYWFETIEECYEFWACGVSDTDSEEICEDEHTPDFYWSATAAVEECEIDKMTSCAVWFPSEDASDEEWEYFADNIYPCRAEMEAEDVAEEAWSNSPEGQSIAQDCWGEM